MKTYAYFGFANLNSQKNARVVVRQSLQPLYGHYFSHLKLPYESVISDVYLGCFYLLFNTDKCLHQTHFKISKSLALENDHAKKEVYPDCSDTSLGLTNTYVLTKTGEWIELHDRCHAKQIKCSFHKNDHKIKKIVTEDLLDLLLTEDGNVCIKIGKGLNEICSEENRQHPSIFQELRLCQPIKDVACGKEHVLLLSNSGCVFSYGYGIRGQLGHGSIECKDKPEIIEALEGIAVKCIAAGGWHSAAVSDAGDLYVWGWNESGQLGFPCSQLREGTLSKDEIETVCCLPKIVDLGEEVVRDVGCGSRHTAALTEKNDLWTWGGNEYGQLGRTSEPLSDTPGKVDLPDVFHPVSLKCKFWSTLVVGYTTEGPES